MEGNQMKMREALEFVAHMYDSPYTTYDVLVAVQKARAALSSPPRNCDLFSCYSEAADYWHENVECADVNGCFDVWLFAPAAERKGDGE